MFGTDPFRGLIHSVSLLELHLYFFPTGVGADFEGGGEESFACPSYWAAGVRVRLCALLSYSA